MERAEMERLLQRQRQFFQTGATLPVDFRIAMLKRLRDAIRAREAEICRALQEDLGKSRMESYFCEVGLALSEISDLIRHTARWARKRPVPTPLSQFAARSWVQPSPYGNVLIMSPWNYPFLLTVEPLADAIAAGNTALVKPSAYAPASGRVLEALIGDCFPPEYAAVVTGGRAENTCLLEQKFDLIFFTGSQRVGREVLRHAAEHLTPAVLELGGKSPCIVDETANLQLAARRIVFGKFLNCGQTCVAPDYILCDAGIKDRLIQALKQEVRRQFGEQPLENPDYGKIISPRHMERILRLMDPDKVVFGGRWAGQRIEPTILDGVTWQDPVMQEEIFGPVLPVLTYGQFEDIFSMLADRPKPLALYLFSEDRQRVRAVTTRCTYGGGCINDVVVHLATSHMGFGGVGESGMGAYHGRTGFEAFSHRKSILDKKTWMDLPMRYQPYGKKAERLIRLFLK